MNSIASRTALAAAAAASVALTVSATPLSAAPAPSGPGAVKDVLLVHGAFVDGSGWRGVHDRLKADGYNVTVVQIATASLADDVALTRRAVAAAAGPVILVGHSYGGVVISEAGTDPKVKGLVYVAAFAPDKGESVQSLIANPPPEAPAAPLLPPQDGFVTLDKARFHTAFAADLGAEDAAFMADSQQPWGLAAVAGQVTAPAWKTKPSWYLVAQDDRMIPAAAQHAMAGRAGAAVVESPGSHVVFVSRPQVVADLIEAAAQSVSAKAK